MDHIDELLKLDKQTTFNDLYHEALQAYGVFTGERFVVNIGPTDALTRFRKIEHLGEELPALEMGNKVVFFAPIIPPRGAKPPETYWTTRYPEVFQYRRLVFIRPRFTEAVCDELRSLACTEEYRAPDFEAFEKMRSETQLIRSNFGSQKLLEQVKQLLAFQQQIKRYLCSEAINVLSTLDRDAKELIEWYQSQR